MLIYTECLLVPDTIIGAWESLVNKVCPQSLHYSEGWRGRQLIKCKNKLYSMLEDNMFYGGKDQGGKLTWGCADRLQSA